MHTLDPILGIVILVSLTIGFAAGVLLHFTVKAIVEVFKKLGLYK